MILQRAQGKSAEQMTRLVYYGVVPLADQSPSQV